MTRVLVEAIGLCSPETDLIQSLDLALTDSTYFLVGRNGSGKSTLAALLAKPSERVRHFGSVGYLSQGLEPFSGTVVQKLGVAKHLAALQRIEEGSVDPDDFSLAEGHWDLRATLLKELDSHGLSEHLLDSAWECLSGGERTRLSLLALHRKRHDFHILDEPSNHLDACGRQWLHGWIKDHPACLVISHDLPLLKQGKQILELTRGRIQSYGGGWQDYLASKKEQELYLEREQQKAEKTVLDRKRAAQKNREQTESRAAAGSKKRSATNQAKVILDAQKEKSDATRARLATLNQQRLAAAMEQKKQAGALLEIIKPQSFIVSPVEERRKKSLSVDALRLPYGQMNPLGFHLPFGEHLWLRGNNGKGKSTLLKVLMGTLQPLSGTIHSTDSIAMLDQHFSLLNDQASAIDNFARLSPGLSRERCHTVLAQIRLRSDAALLPVSTLSGGERLKLALACVFSGNRSPALLLLDEPDNHLDLDSRSLLIDALKQYEGSLVIISHDETFIEAIGVQHQLLLT